MKNPTRRDWHCSARRAAAVTTLGLLLTRTPGAAADCVGDCDGDSEVTINELITMVHIAIESAFPSLCPIGDADCLTGRCVKCKPFGGDGCAANCTLETDIPFSLVPGGVAGLALADGTSGTIVHRPSLTTPLPLTGHQTLTVGKDRGDGIIPLVIKAASAQFPRIPVGTLACACLRAVPLKTCGGTLFEADGTLSLPCTEGFVNKFDCRTRRPCVFVHGPENSASGILGCGHSGLAGINVNVVQDAGGCGNPPNCSTRTEGQLILTAGGGGPQGSGFILSSTALGILRGTCRASFCTDADPLELRGTPQTAPFTTGTARAEVFNANFLHGVNIGPVAATGAPVDCSKLAAMPPSVSGITIVGAFPALGQPPVGDIVVTDQFVAQ